MTAPSLEPTNSQHFRSVLGHYPTGVCAVTSRVPSGEVLVMIVGSFGSVSLDPPLVGFFPARTSTTWPQLAATGGFCVNILAHDQLDLCRKLAGKDPDRLSGIDWRPAPSGAPILPGAVAWMDCALHQVTPAGDHDLVLGLVRAFGVENDKTPLIFLRGGYGVSAAPSNMPG